VLQRVFDWFSGLNLAQKVLAVLFAGLFLFTASYLVTTAFLTLRGYGDRSVAPSAGQSAAPQGTGPGSAGSGSASAELPPCPTSRSR
jgi:hypothetical protein